jgi:NAD(P)-dependent dehydrogenase (short-subunit alcohol dehydrogenase family)
VTAPPSGGALAGRAAIVFGVERPAARRAAVALAEAGADVAVVTLSEDTQAEFAANSTANEFWAIGRKGMALTSDGRETTITEAIADAAAELGPIAVLVWHSPTTPPRDVLAGLRSDPAIVVLIDEEEPGATRALLAWTRELAGTGLRANALCSGRPAAGATDILRTHTPPEVMDLAHAAVYLASDATAAIEGALVIALEQ